MGELDGMGRMELIRLVCELRVKLAALEGDIHAERAKRLDAEATCTHAQAAGSRAVLERQEMREKIALFLEQKGQSSLAEDVRLLIAERSS